ncbi:hypothetical protein FG91_02263 [Sphingopyxis sp. LC81]|nr:hypothetical protein FG91_02263 [Sphingopyxis sp. LC81]
MVVREDDTACADVEGAGEQAAQIALDMARATFDENLVGEITPFMGDESYVQPFGRCIAEKETEIGSVGRVARRDGISLDLLAKPGMDEPPCGKDRAGEFAIGAKRVGKLLGGCSQRDTQTPEMSDQALGSDRRASAREGLEEFRHDRYGP